MDFAPHLLPATCRSHTDSSRHGWGCEPIPEKAVFYLSAAAKNAADVESLALQAGLKKGGAAKGELVLAIFELANCFRQGWGIDKDPIAAKQVCDFHVRPALTRCHAWVRAPWAGNREAWCTTRQRVWSWHWACKHAGV
jgi:hypothetical protein